MKRNVAYGIVLFVFLGSAGFSQSYVFQFQQKGSKLWGYASTNGQIIIEPKFVLSSPFSKQGVATVLYKDQYAITDLKGEIIKTDVEYIRPNINFWNGLPQTFIDGYLVVGQNYLFGCLNHTGQLAIPIQYTQLTVFDGGFALAERDKIFFVVDKQGKEIPLEAKDIVNIWHFSEGLGPIEVIGQKWGFVDSNGKTVIDPQYDVAGYFNAGLAWARTFDGKVGYINQSGEWAIEPQFEAAKDFDLESGLAMVKVNGIWGYADKQGKISYFNETDKVYEFSDGLAIGLKDGKIGFLNNKGQWAIQPKYDGARPFYYGYAAAEMNRRWGIIDKAGNWIVQPIYKDIKDVAEVE
jgi:hypothetical protein